jgi:hypothetical protein
MGCVARSPVTCRRAPLGQMAESKILIGDASEEFVGHKNENEKRILRCPMAGCIYFVGS